MSATNVVVSEHALKAMLNRSIRLIEVEQVITEGEAIADYPSDRPYPSKLFLKFITNRPIHVVAAWNAANATWIIITCYIPEENLWDKEFKTKVK